MVQEGGEGGREENVGDGVEGFGGYDRGLRGKNSAQFVEDLSEEGYDGGN